MTDISSNSSLEFTDSSLRQDSSRRIPVFALGMSLSTFLVVTYVVCLIFDLWFPQFAMNEVWSPLLPGFVWLSWSSFFLGFAETALYGWYIAIVFGSLHNFFIRRY